MLGPHKDVYPGNAVVVPESKTLSPKQIVTGFPALTTGPGVIVVFTEIGSDSQPY